MKDVQDSKPRNWWREVNQLCGSAKTTGRDLTSILHPDLVCDESTLVDKINKAFVRVMEDYSPLTERERRTSHVSQNASLPAILSNSRHHVVRSFEDGCVRRGTVSSSDVSEKKAVIFVLLGYGACF